MFCKTWKTLTSGSDVIMFFFFNQTSAIFGNFKYKKYATLKTIYFWKQKLVDKKSKMRKAVIALF